MTSPDLAQLSELLTQWTAKAIDGYSARSVFLFGSLIHKGGVQFNESSDIDLVVVMPKLENALARHRWLEVFREHKEALEFQLMRTLRRNALEPLASVIAITELELVFDIHKDGHRQFFTANTFRNLHTNAETVGLPDAGSQSTDRFIVGSLAFTQKIRNEYFAVSANGSPTLIPYDGTDPLPKRMMRAAAMAARAANQTSEPGGEHDVKEGLDLLSVKLYDRRSEAPLWNELQDVVSVRRQARGRHGPVEPTHQLLVAELIFDIACSGGLSRSNTSTNWATNSFSTEQTDPKIDSEVKTIGIVTAPTTRVDEPLPKGRLISMPFGSTTVFFADRFASAFPGVRSTKWFDDPNEISVRLLALLKAPLSFSDGQPIWYWRGGNLHIKRFEPLDGSKFIMNADELNITRIAAVPGRSYQRSFVYVQTGSMAPTGLYPESYAIIQDYIDRNGYYDEEYGLFRGNYPLTRSEYDDGAAMIGGKLVETIGQSELRIRYVSPYNFVIAAQGSPINNPRFDEELQGILNGALKEDAERAIELLYSKVNMLPLRDSPVS